jgi:hypothetical protein
MSAFGYTRYGQNFGVAARDGGVRISDKLLEATDRLATALFELGSCAGLEKNYTFLYPFVGGTQVAHSINLADPSKNRIAFEDDTTVTHNSLGITGPGNVQLFPFEKAGATPTVAECCCAYGVYQRSGVSADQYDMMCYNPAVTTAVAHGIVCRRATYGDTVYWNGVNSGSGYIAVANSNPQGFYTSMRANETNHHVYKNGVNVGGIGTGAAANSATFYLFGGNSHNIAYCFLTKSWNAASGYGGGIPHTGPMQTTLYAIVQKFQTWCGRQV